MGYTQSPHLTGEEIESLLKEAKIARSCSLNPDGTIHAVPVWFKYENGRIIITTPQASRKARNVKRNSNVTILIDITGPPLENVKGVIVYGKANMKDATLSELTSINEKYMPRGRAETWSRGLWGLTQWVMIIVTPERIASFDYAKDNEFLTAVRG